MAPRQKTITMVPGAAESAQEAVGQGKRPDKGQFRLEVDRQTKATYGTYEAAERPGSRSSRAAPFFRLRFTTPSAVSTR